MFKKESKLLFFFWAHCCKGWFFLHGIDEDNVFARGLIGFTKGTVTFIDDLPRTKVGCHVGEGCYVDGGAGEDKWRLRFHCYEHVYYKRGK